MYCLDSFPRAAQQLLLRRELLVRVHLEAVIQYLLEVLEDRSGGWEDDFFDWLHEGGFRCYIFVLGQVFAKRFKSLQMGDDFLQIRQILVVLPSLCPDPDNFVDKRHEIGDDVDVKISIRKVEISGIFDEIDVLNSEGDLANLLLETFTFV